MVRKKSQAKSNFRFLDQDRDLKFKRRFYVLIRGAHTSVHCSTPPLLDSCSALTLISIPLTITVK
jgi:hypothetical protein